MDLFKQHHLAQPETTDREENIKRFFRQLSDKDLISWRETYLKRIAEENNPDKKIKFPWMLPHWQKGLELCEQVISEKTNKA